MNTLHEILEKKHPNEVVFYQPEDEFFWSVSPEDWVIEYITWDQGQTFVPLGVEKDH